MSHISHSYLTLTPRPHTSPSQVSYCRNTSSEEEKEMKRLREEVAMMGRLRHRNVVRCLGAVHVQGHFNIFVEWMAGM